MQSSDFIAAPERLSGPIHTRSSVAREGAGVAVSRNHSRSGSIGHRFPVCSSAEGSIIKVLVAVTLMTDTSPMVFRGIDRSIANYVSHTTERNFRAFASASYLLICNLTDHMYEAGRGENLNIAGRFIYILIEHQKRILSEVRQASPLLNEYRSFRIRLIGRNPVLIRDC